MIAWVLKPYPPAVVVAALLVMMDALATGALHLMDWACAAAISGGKIAMTLWIICDHAIGSCGGLALSVVALKMAAYTSLLAQPAEKGLDTALIVALTLADGRFWLLTAML